MKRIAVWFGSLGLGGLLIVLSGCQVGDGTIGALSEPVSSEPTVEIHRVPGGCSWWGGLSQADRNQRIVLEALYAVDRQIWDQNERCTCSWSSYLAGSWNCFVPGDWAYSNRYPGQIARGGPCKEFAREVIRRASGDIVVLPSGYDFRAWFPWRNRQDAINNSQPGELIQFTGSVLHTVLIVTNFHDGRFEVVDSNARNDEKIIKHVIRVNQGSYATADMKAYVIDCL